MKLNTHLDWAIKCPNCMMIDVYSTDRIFVEDNRLNLTFSCNCLHCKHHFGYIQTYVNDSSTDKYAGIEEMKDYQL